MSKEHICCFFGHRKINETEDLKNNLYGFIEQLILNKKVDTFLFGSKSEFDKFCLKVVTALKEKYPHIRRIYVRAEFPCINNDYRDYLLEKYDDTYYLTRLVNAGKAAYVERNYEMIDNSRYCIIYYDENYVPLNRKSGTKIAYDYAIKKGTEIINLFSINSMEGF